MEPELEFEAVGEEAAIVSGEITNGLVAGEICMFM
jgi:hypothetical protein